MQLPFDQRRDIMQIFATPLGTFSVPNAAQLTPRIAKVILAREKAEVGIDRSNKGGWHSDDKLMNWPELEFADLGDTFRSAVSHMISLTSGKQRFNIKLTMSSWANVNRAVLLTAATFIRKTTGRACFTYRSLIFQPIRSKKPATSSSKTHVARSACWDTRPGRCFINYAQGGDDHYLPFVALSQRQFFLH